MNTLGERITHAMTSTIHVRILGMYHGTNDTKAHENAQNYR